MKTYQLANEGTWGVFTGILNCRVNGEHLQVRF